MTYTGEAAVGGPALEHRLAKLSISKLAVGPMDNNAYLLRCTSRDAPGILIDAANEPARLLDLIGDLPLAAVVTTHQHADHWQALAEVVTATGADVIAHELDAGPLPVPATRLVAHDDEIPVGDCTLRVIHLRGHTPGSIALAYDDPDGHPHLFTGDSLFPGGVGKTWSPEDFTSLLADVETRLFATLPDETWVYPGHGNDTTLGTERPHLEEWRGRGW